MIFTKQENKQLINEITRVSWAADVTKNPRNQAFKFIRLNSLDGVLTITATNGIVLNYGKIGGLGLPDCEFYLSAKVWRRLKLKEIELDFENWILFSHGVEMMNMITPPQLESNYGRYPSCQSIINQETGAGRLIKPASEFLKIRLVVLEHEWGRDDKVINFNIAGDWALGSNKDALNLNYREFFKVIKKAPKNSVIEIVWARNQNYLNLPVKILVNGEYWGSIAPIKVFKFKVSKEN